MRMKTGSGGTLPGFCENCDATRCADARVHAIFLWSGVPVRPGLPEVEVTGMQMDAITGCGLAISILLMVYLTVTLLFPEKF